MYTDTTPIEEMTFAQMREDIRAYRKIGTALLDYTLVTDIEWTFDEPIVLTLLNDHRRLLKENAELRARIAQLEQKEGGA